VASHIVSASQKSGVRGLIGKGRGDRGVLQEGGDLQRSEMAGELGDLDMELGDKSILGSVC